MAKSIQNILLISITDNRGSFERVLHKGDAFTIGTAPHNDVVVFDERFPTSMPLFSLHAKSCTVQINTALQGDIRSEKSILQLADLIEHNLLEQKNGLYQLELKGKREGRLVAGDTHISWQYTMHSPVAATLPDYSWRKAAGRDISKELLFKCLLTLFIAFEIWFALHLQNIELPPEEPPPPVQVQKRYARFMLDAQPTAAQQQMATAVKGGGTENNESESTDNLSDAEQQSAQRQIEKSGLLGLIGGNGTSSNRSATADFILSESVVQELDELLDNATLRQTTGKRSNGTGTGSGNGTGSGDLLGLGSSTDVDNILAETGGISSVQLERQGNVNIQQPRAIRGSQQATGSRTQESVMQIINAQHGRIMYTYNRYLKQNPELRGKISVDITIAADGRVSSVSVLESSMGNQDFVRDVVNILRRLRFGAIQEGSVTVNLPFVFNRVG